MRYELKPYQEIAVNEVLSKLHRAKNYYRNDDDLSAFALTAVTGAGKTVMAAAVLEALLFGTDTHEADPNAVVLWFSDSPELNTQSMLRIEQASSKLYGYMTMIENTFKQDILDTSHVYFLNTQKLSKKSMLVRGRTEDSSAYDFWKTLANTINDSNKNVYLIIDEAHRGMKKRSVGAERKSIVQQLINGFDDVPPIPIVWGISATISRFQDTIKGMDDRTTISPVTIDTKDVQESGLLKDIINLDFATEEGNYESVLLRRATKTLKKVSRDWDEYCANEDFEPVLPLMVVGVKNQISDRELGEYIAVISEEFPALDTDSFAHVLGDKGDIDANGYTIRHISAERVQDTPSIRVLFAKEAVTTGWDCPRAEVLMSFRPAQDMDYVTQIMGRIIRTPLAMRIPGNEVLNAVHAFLPRFDESSVTKVAEQLSKGGTDIGNDDGTVTRKVLTHPATMVPVANDDLWAVFDDIPTHTVSRTIAKPVTRLSRIAHLLASEGIVKGAGAEATRHLHNLLDGNLVQYKDAVSHNLDDLTNVEGAVVSISLNEDADEARTEYTETADRAAVDDYFKAAKRALSTSLANSYLNHLNPLDYSDPDFDQDEFEDDMLTAKLKIAALARIPEVMKNLDDEANRIVDDWDSQYRADIRTMSDLKKAEYNALKSTSGRPESSIIIRPGNLVVSTKEETEVVDRATGSKSRTTADIPAFKKHVLADADGNFYDKLNQLEQHVLAVESGRGNMIGWYRNPATTSDSTLSIPYQDGEDKWKLLRPDFIVFNEVNGTIRPSIVDPHGHHLSDSLPKLQGLSKYADKYGNQFYRIDAITKIKDKYRRLDLREERVRDAIANANNAEELFNSDVADDYN